MKFWLPVERSLVGSHDSTGLSEVLASLVGSLVAAHLESYDRLSFPASVLHWQVGNVSNSTKRHSLLRCQLVRSHLQSDHRVSGFHLLVRELACVLLGFSWPQRRPMVSVGLRLKIDQTLSKVETLKIDQIRAENCNDSC